MYIQLKRGNDWGVEYLSRAPLGPSGTASAARAYRLIAGDVVTVRTKNGDQRGGVIRSRTRHNAVSDMGHSYEVSSRVPYVEFPDGTEADLTKIEIEYDPSKDPTAGEK